jgi:3-deoxy-D-manno-octulosonate 8-phosphate phosphatase (KDO 8-P phosphatase)
MIKLLIIDIDGVMTNGRKLYDKTGLCIAKEFCDKDWTAIKRFKAAGVAVHALTGDPWNEGILAARNILAHFTRGVEKEDFLPELCQRYRVMPQECAYIGDDVFDMGILLRVGYPFCPKDAIKDFREDEPHICRLESDGGENVLMELFELCIDEGWIPEYNFNAEYAKIQELDKLEKF